MNEDGKRGKHWLDKKTFPVFVRFCYLLHLAEEMKSFTQQTADPLFEFTFLQFCISFLLSLLLGLLLGLTVNWKIGLGVGLAVFLLQYIFLGMPLVPFLQ